MNFQGFYYDDFNPYVFSTEPSFDFENQNIEGNVEIGHLNIHKSLYQFNLCHILQCILFLNEKTKKISKKMFSQCDSQSIMFLKKGKGNIVQEFGNTGLKILTKICRECDDQISFFNEYYVGIFGINYLRMILPTFSFVYTFENKAKKKVIQQEFIDRATTLHSLLKKKQLSTEEIISIFFQLLFSLEVAQNSLLFTHYDLHADNILIQENTDAISLHFPIFDKHISMKPKYIVKIIDYGFSTITLPENKIYSCCNNENFLKFGYYPFFTPGTDLFRVIIGLFSYNVNEELFRFFLFIFEQFYKLKPEIITETNFKTFFHNHFYNISFSPIVQKTPLELLHFILENTQELSSILKMDDFPFTISLNKTHKQEYSRKEKDTFKNKFHLKKLSKSFQETNPLFHFFSKKTSSQRQKQKIKDLNFSDIPIFNAESTTEIELYFQERSWFIDYFEDYCFKHFITKTPDKFSSKIVKYSKFYKNLKAIQCWIEYIKEDKFPKKKETIQYVRKYNQSLSHLFL